MEKSFRKLRLLFAGIVALALLTTSCSSDDSDDDVRKPSATAKFSETIADLKVTFKNESTNAKTYIWDFGDQNSSTEKEPAHEYSEAGTYIVTLTATGDGGENKTSKSITVVGGDDGNGDGNGGEGAKIVVDGDFSDWADVPEDILFTAVLDEESTDYERLKEVKVTSDDMYIYLYLKLDGKNANALDIYINNDLSPDTGYNGWMWQQLAANYLIQGFYNDKYDMRLAAYDESKDGGWGWISPDIVEAGSGLMEISEMKKVSGTIVEFEAKIVRELIPGLGSEIRMSFGHSGIEGDAWATSGGLPTVTAEGDKNKGLLVKLK